MSKPEVTEKLIDILYREYLRMASAIYKPCPSLEHVAIVYRKLFEAEYALEEALTELISDVERNSKYKCPKCGHVMRSCENYQNPPSEEINYTVCCSNCDFESVKPCKSRVFALLDWFGKCNKEEKNERLGR